MEAIMTIINQNPIAFGCLLVGMCLIPAITGSFLYSKHKRIAIALYVISTTATFFISEIFINDSHNNVQDWDITVQIATHVIAVLVTLCWLLVLFVNSLVGESERQHLQS